MQQRSLTVMLLFMVVSGHLSFVTAKHKETTCSPNDVMMAMTICQGERQKLSYASQHNNTAQLCIALQHYSDCMKPRVQGCQGPAKMAFDVITSKYTGEPYKCQLDMKTDTVFSNVSNKTNKINTHDFHEHLNTASGVNLYNSSEDSDVMDISEDIRLHNQQSYLVNMSTETPTTVPSMSMTKLVPTTKFMTATTSSDTFNSATLQDLAVSTAVFSTFVITQMWR